MTHLTPDELVDAVEDALSPDRVEHATSCPVCRASVDELARLLGLTRDTTVPEPSPLFWDHFSARVRAAIATERPPATGVSAWLRWSVLVPIGGLALLVAMIALAMPRGVEVVPQRAPAVARSLLADAVVRGDDEPWTFVSEVVGGVSLDEAERAGLVFAPGAAERAVTSLTAAERDELMRLLTAALARPAR